MMDLKSCPRCQKSDMYLDEDDSPHCMQWGYVRYQAKDTLAAYKLAKFLGLEDLDKKPTAASG